MDFGPPWTMTQLAERIRAEGEDALIDALGPLVLVTFGVLEGAGGWTLATRVIQSPVAAPTVEPDVGASLVYPLRKRGGVETDPIFVGRAKSNDVPIEGGTVSKVHARIRVDGDRFLVEDAGSRNGTFVEGEKVREETPIQAGDTLHFGTSGFRVQDSRRLCEMLKRLQPSP